MPQGKAWIAELRFDGGTQGAAAYELLASTLPHFYRTENAGETKVSPSEISIKVDDRSKDRPLTAQVAQIAKVPVRDGKAKGKRKGDNSNAAPLGKRQSPEPDRAGNKQSRTGR